MLLFGSGDFGMMWHLNPITCAPGTVMVCLSES
jgi:hypothetical protein